MTFILGDILLTYANKSLVFFLHNQALSRAFQIFNGLPNAKYEPLVMWKEGGGESRLMTDPLPPSKNLNFEGLLKGSNCEEKNLKYSKLRKLSSQHQDGNMHTYEFFVDYFSTF